MASDACAGAQAELSFDVSVCERRGQLKGADANTRAAVVEIVVGVVAVCSATTSDSGGT